LPLHINNINEITKPARKEAGPETIRTGRMQGFMGVWMANFPFGVEANRKGTLLKAGVSSLALMALSTGGSALAQEAEEPVAVAVEDGTENAIVVTGRRAALQAAEQRKKNSEGIIDSVVADEAGKLPDNSITEVLQRVSGVSIVRFAALNDPDHFSIEGSGIQVRGLTGVASRLNGRDIFSANSGRSLLWGDVTPELMAAVDVYKAATADLIEGGTGGQIDLRTKLPFDFSGGWQVAGSAQTSYGDLARAWDYGGSAMVSNRWDTGIGEIGVLVDLAHSRLTSRSNFFRAEPYFRRRLAGETADVFIPGGYNYGDEEFQRDRTGIYAAVQWSPSDDLDFTGIFFQSKYKNKNQSHFAQQVSQDLAVNRANSMFDRSGGLIKTEAMFLRDPNTFLPTGGRTTGSGGTEGTLSESLTRDMSLEFDWNPGQGPLAIGGSYQHVKSTSDLDRLAVFRDVPFPSTFSLDLTGDLPEVVLGPQPEDSFSNPANYLWAAAMPHSERNRGTMDAANLDLEYTFENSFFRSVKIGGRWSERRERDLNNGFTWSALGRGWNGSPQLSFANAAPGDVEFYAFDHFFHGDLPVPANTLWPSVDLIRNTNVDDLHQNPPAGFCPDAFNCVSSGPLTESTYGGARSRTGGFLLPNDLREWRTESLSGYGLVRFGRDYEPGTIGFSGNVGLRVVKTENESLGYIVQNSTSFIRNGQVVTLANTVQPRGGTRSFTRVLPSVNLQIEPHEDIKARAAFSRTMDLPTFEALRGSGTVGVTTTTNPGGSGLPAIFSNFTADTGNPFLAPTMSRNLDLSLEWYPKPGTTFHIAAFDKRITNLPIRSLALRDVTVYFTPTDTDPNNNSVIIGEETVTGSATDTVNATVPAKVRGVEVGGRTFFDTLPGIWGGFGIEANYTFIDSSNPGDLYRDIFGTIRNDAPLQGLSKHNANATLMYERGRVSARVAYSWRSKYLQSTNSNGTTPTYTYVPAPGAPGQSIQIALPVYGDAYGQVDAGFTFRWNDHISFSVEGANIFNATQRTLMGGYNNDAIYTRSWFQSDRRISFGVNFVL
jgi:TonB-dependent receptor